MPITRTTQTHKAGLLLASALLLVACQGAVSQASNCPPPRPSLVWTPGSDGGVCVSRESTADLLDYLDALERCEQ